MTNLSKQTGDDLAPVVKHSVNVQSDLQGLTGNDIPSFALPPSADPILLALELSELARVLGGDWVARPANVKHQIFLL